MLAERGLQVSYETIWRWCLKFGQSYAHQLKRRFTRADDEWQLDEVQVVINGQLWWLWRAKDKHGQVLDPLQERRNKQAAKRFFRQLLNKTAQVSQVIVTDMLRSYGVAHREVMPNVEHRQHKGINKPAETSHQPTRERERRMKGFKSIGYAQRFLSVMGTIGNHFRPRRHLRKASDYRATMR